MLNLIRRIKYFAHQAARFYVSESLSFVHEFLHVFAHLRGVAGNHDSCGLKGSNLRFSVTLAAGDDGTGVAHAAAGGRSLTRNERNNGQFASVVLLKPLGSLFLGLTANLANHDDALSLGVLHEAREAVNKVGAVEGVTTNANNGRLTQTLSRSLVDSLVGQSTGAGNDTNLALAVDVAGHDADLAFTGLDNTGAVRSDKSCLVLGLHD